jgi:hypothetical protein
MMSKKKKINAKVSKVVEELADQIHFILAASGKQ